MKSKHKFIYISVFNNFISKNILNTDVFLELRESGNFTIVLLVPKLKHDFFIKYYSHPHVRIEPVDELLFGSSKIETFLSRVSMLLVKSHYLHYRRLEILELDSGVLGRLKHWVRTSIAYLLGGRKYPIAAYRLLNRILVPKDFFAAIFEKYPPSLVFCADIFSQPDNQLAHEARLRGVRTVGMVRSWDNCHSKGILRSFHDAYIVNNEVIRDELLSIHGVTEGQIHVVGLPQFDNFVRLPLTDREKFFQSYGLDPGKRLIMFAPAGTMLSDTDADICDILFKAHEQHKLPADVQFFIRNHPGHPADLQKYDSIPGFFLQNPGEVVEKTTGKGTELTPTDLDFLRNIVGYTDVLVWVATSLCHDALVYDVPEIVINFDGYQKKDYYHSVRKYHDEDQMKKMFALKPFRVANGPDDLIQYINMYLKDRTIDSGERKRAREQQLFCIDGGAGRRIVEILEHYSA